MPSSQLRPSGTWPHQTLHPPRQRPLTTASGMHMYCVVPSARRRDSSHWPRTYFTRRVALWLPQASTAHDSAPGLSTILLCIWGNSLGRHRPHGAGALTATQSSKPPIVPADDRPLSVSSAFSTTATLPRARRMGEGRGGGFGRGLAAGVCWSVSARAECKGLGTLAANLHRFSTSSHPQGCDLLPLRSPHSPSLALASSFRPCPSLWTQTQTQADAEAQMQTPWRSFLTTTRSSTVLPLKNWTQSPARSSSCATSRGTRLSW